MSGFNGRLIGSLLSLLASYEELAINVPNNRQAARGGEYSNPDVKAAAVKRIILLAKYLCAIYAGDITGHDHTAPVGGQRRSLYIGRDIIKR